MIKQEAFNEFRNNVFCRRYSNQHKAKKIWKEVSSIMHISDKTLFQIEWAHFMMGEIDIDKFSLYFDNYVQKYYLSSMNSTF